jgi:hypothetical protein
VADKPNEHAGTGGARALDAKIVGGARALDKDRRSSAVSHESSVAVLVS